MNVERVIAWNRANETPIRLVSVSEKGYSTPHALHEKGMYVCDCCGAINSIDRDRCSECSEEKFILLDKSE